MHRSLVVTIALTAIFVGCSEHSAFTDSDAAVVRVEDNFFVPQQFDIAPGVTVSWTWRGNNPHNVTFDDGPASATQVVGGYERQFGAAGTYPYRCTIHGPSMAGSVLVR